MANRKKKNARMGRGGKIALWITAALLIVLTVTAGVGAVNATIVRVRRCEVVLPDLPPAFDGTRLLYASDIDLCGLNTPHRGGELFHQLQSLRPDMLLLGGDYNSSSLIELLNRPADSAVDISGKLKDRADFFHYIMSFDVPLGKYAIAAPEDQLQDELKLLMEECGVRPLFNDRVAIQKDGETLWLVGICTERPNLNAAGLAFRREECVVVMAYSPTMLPILLTSEAANGGPWYDMTLCGHTHGGQIRLFGRNALNLDSQESRALSGWHIESGQPILITTGVGCEGINLRLGSEPEVWLITLRRE